MSGSAARVPLTIGIIKSANPSPSKYCMVVFFSIGYNVPGLTQSGLGTNQAGEIGYLALSANLRQPLN